MRLWKLSDIQNLLSHNQNLSNGGGIHTGIFTKKFIRAALKELQNSDHLRLCLFERKDASLFLDSTSETLSPKIQLKELTLCMSTDPEYHIESAILPSDIQKATIMLRSNSTPVSAAYSVRLVRFLCKITRLSLLKEMTIFIDGMRLENLYSAQELIEKLPKVDSLTFGYIIATDCDEQSYAAALSSLANTFKSVQGIKRVIIATSTNNKFNDIEIKHYAAIEKSLISSEKVNYFLFKRVENITKLFYTGRGDLI